MRTGTIYLLHSSLYLQCLPPGLHVDVCSRIRICMWSFSQVPGAECLTPSEFTANELIHAGEGSRELQDADWLPESLTDQRVTTLSPTSNFQAEGGEID